MKFTRKNMWSNNNFINRMIAYVLHVSDRKETFFKGQSYVVMHILIGLF